MERTLEIRVLAADRVEIAEHRGRGRSMRYRRLTREEASIAIAAFVQAECLRLNAIDAIPVEPGETPG